MKKVIILLAIISLASCKGVCTSHYSFVKKGERTIYTNSYLVRGDSVSIDEVIRGGKTRPVTLPLNAGYRIIHN